MYVGVCLLNYFEFWFFFLIIWSFIFKKIIMYKREKSNDTWMIWNIDSTNKKSSLKNVYCPTTLRSLKIFPFTSYNWIYIFLEAIKEMEMEVMILISNRFTNLFLHFSKILSFQNFLVFLFIFRIPFIIQKIF